MRKITQQLFERGGIGQNNWLLGMLACVILVNIINTGVALTRFNPVAVQVPIRYTTLTAFDRLGSWQELLVLPLASWSIAIVNTGLAHISYRRSRVTSFMLMLSSLALGLLALQIIWFYAGVTHGAR